MHSLVLALFIAAAPSSPLPCGDYENPNDPIFKRLRFEDGNRVLVDTGMMKATFTYFVDGDVLHVRTDTGFVRLRLTREALLTGDDPIVKGETWTRARPPSRSCSAPTGPQLKVVERDRCALEADAKVKAGNRGAPSPYEKCCTLGDAESCNRHGMILGLRGNAADARRYYERACDAGAGTGCRNAADQEKRSGNANRAKELYEKGCKLKNVDSCLALEGL